MNTFKPPIYFTIIRAGRVFLGPRGDRSEETHFSIMLSIVWWWWRLPPLVAAKGDMLSISLGSRSRTHNTLQFVERSSRTEMVHGRLSSLPLSLPFFPGWPCSVVVAIVNCDHCRSRHGNCNGGHGRGGSDGRGL